MLLLSAILFCVKGTMSRSRSRKYIGNTRLTDTGLKRLVLVLGLISALNGLIMANELGMPTFSLVLLAVIQLLMLWLTLYQLTCFRDGGCNTFSQIVGILTVVSSMAGLLFPKLWLQQLT